MGADVILLSVGILSGTVLWVVRPGGPVGAALFALAAHVAHQHQMHADAVGYQRRKDDERWNKIDRELGRLAGDVARLKIGGTRE